MSKQPDFQRQQSRLQKEIEATGNLIIFYSKFHCELNFIEQYFSFFFFFSISTSQLSCCRFWCAAKYYACENCKYSPKGLHETVLKALDLVIISAIFYYYQHCIKIIEIYHSELEYETKQFTDAIYSSHKQIVDNSKW